MRPPAQESDVGSQILEGRIRVEQQQIETGVQAEAIDHVESALVVADGLAAAEALQGVGGARLDPEKDAEKPEADEQ